MKARTEIDFDYSGDAQKLVDEWAREHHYHLKGNENDMRVYQRGSGFWTAPMRLAFSQNSKNVHLEAYVFAPFLNRLISFFIVPKESHLGSGGFVASVPRAMARKDVNQLLADFGQPPIN